MFAAAIGIASLLGFWFLRANPAERLGEREPHEGHRSQAPTGSAAGSLASTDIHGEPANLTIAGGLVWVLRLSDDSVVGIESATGRLVRSVPLDGPPRAITTHMGNVWIAITRTTRGRTPTPEGELVELRGSDGKPLRTVPLRRPADLSSDGTTLWTTSIGGSVGRLDPGTNKVLEVAEVKSPLVRMAAGKAGVWVSDETQRIFRVEPGNNRTVAPLGIPEPINDMLVGAGALWIAGAQGHVWRVDLATNKVVAELQAGQIANGLTFYQGALWVSDAEGSVVIIDSGSNRIRDALRVGGMPTAIAAAGGGGGVFLSDSARHSVRRIR